VEDSENCKTIHFGALTTPKLSDCITVTRFLPLETTTASLIGAVDQLEVIGDKIVLLDGENSNSVFVFSAKDGKLISQLSGKGNGPGEFLMPNSFWINKSDSSLFVLDVILSKLIKYSLPACEYQEEITVPDNFPIAFAVLPDSSQFMYYNPSYSEERSFSGNQIAKADKQGNILSTYYPISPSGRVLHGSPAAFYEYEDRLCIVPYFNDKVYEWKNDSLCVRYNLSWEKDRIPDESIFGPGDTSDIMKKIKKEGYIRYITVFENPSCLAVRYSMGQDRYLSVWNKKNDRLFNIKADGVADDLGIGNYFPLPVGISGTNELVGILQPQTLDRSKVKDKTLLSILPSIGDEDNPILVFYTIR
jgi:hypothetical protein